MNTRVTLYWKDGIEQSAVSGMAKAFKLAEMAEATGRLRGFVLESERE